MSSAAATEDTDGLSGVREAGDVWRRALLNVDVVSCDSQQLTEFSEIVQRVRATMDALDADIARQTSELQRRGDEQRLDRKHPHARQRSSKQKTDRRRSGILESFPQLDDAVRSGDVTSDYLDVIARATARLTAEERAEFNRRHRDTMADLATDMSLHQFKLHMEWLVERVQADAGVTVAQRQRRDRSVRKWTDQFTGMYQLRGSWDPETGAAIFAAIDRATDAAWRSGRDDNNDDRTTEQLAADAVAALITRQHRSTSTRPSGDPTPTPEPSPAAGTASAPPTVGSELLVLIDYDTLVSGLHPHSVHETGHGDRLPVDVLRRMACDADIIPVVLSGQGAPLDVGRSRRLATPDQRRALRSLYRYCAIDGCDVPFDHCEIHHLRPWSPPSNGPSDLANLIPLCAGHHHQAHDHHWIMTLDATTRVLTVRYPDGSTQLHRPPALRQAAGEDASSGDAAATDRRPHRPPGQPARGAPPPRSAEPAA